MNKQNKGFTLVELIVVITILAILGSIAFVSLQGYGKSARDSARISEVGQFKSGLEIFAAQSGYYMPAGNSEILDNIDTGALSFVGTTGEDLARITNLSEAISDPVTGVEYTYAVAGNKKQYEVYYELEAEDAGIINSASAFDATKKVVTGNYNGVFVIAEKGQVVAMPSLVTTTGTITLGSDSVDFKMSEKDTDVTFTPVKVADTVPTKIAAQKTMVEAIQTAYSGNESLSENIKEVTSLDTTKTSEIESFVIGGLGSDKVDNTVEQDTEAPVDGGISVPASTSTDAITATITCPAEGNTEMQISGDIVGSPLAWESCVSSKSVTLTSEGTKTVSVQFRDEAGNNGTPVSSSVTYSDNACGDGRGSKVYGTLSDGKKFKLCAGSGGTGNNNCPIGYSVYTSNNLDVSNFSSEVPHYFGWITTDVNLSYYTGGQCDDPISYYANSYTRCKVNENCSQSSTGVYNSSHMGDNLYFEGSTTMGLARLGHWKDSTNVMNAVACAYHSGYNHLDVGAGGANCNYSSARMGTIGMEFATTSFTFEPVSTSGACIGTPVENRTNNSVLYGAYLAEGKNPEVIDGYPILCKEN